MIRIAEVQDCEIIAEIHVFTLVHMVNEFAVRVTQKLKEYHIYFRSLSEGRIDIVIILSESCFLTSFARLNKTSSSILNLEF